MDGREMSIIVAVNHELRCCPDRFDLELLIACSSCRCHLEAAQDND